MVLVRQGHHKTDYTDEAAWLAGRKKSLGASEIAIVCGYSTFKSPADLWREKTGKADAEDLSGNPFVVYGKAAEEHLRSLFTLKHADEYDVIYEPFAVYSNDEAPFLTATLDGIIYRKADNKLGVYECKTALVQSRYAAAEWADNCIPQKYYCQNCQQLFATGFDFVVVNAELRHPDGSAEIVERSFERDEALDDIAYVANAGKEFWRYVESNTPPPINLIL